MNDQEFEKLKENVVDELNKACKTNYKAGLIYGALYTSFAWGILLFIFDSI